MSNFGDRLAFGTNLKQTFKDLQFLALPNSLFHLSAPWDRRFNQDQNQNRMKSSHLARTNTTSSKCQSRSLLGCWCTIWTKLLGHLHITPTTTARPVQQSSQCTVFVLIVTPQAVCSSAGFESAERRRLLCAQHSVTTLCNFMRPATSWLSAST